MKLSTIVLVAACGSKQPQPVDRPVVTATAPDASPTTPAPVAMPALSPSPAHRVLEWLVDVITRRKGEVSREEMAEYCGPQFLKPVAGTAESFRTWAKEADGAVLESLEVDDPTYVRGFLATRDHRWKLIIEIEASKLSYLRFESADQK